MASKSFILSVLLAISLSCIAPRGYAQILSSNAEITLLTASPGEELYSVFGHSALRVNDPVLGIDWVYNYGTFDFNTPNFYLKFARGQMFYKLTVVPTEYFLVEYRYDGRAIYEQVLNLTQEQKQQIFDFVQINRLPENAYYLYDFFYDNCATRIRDLVDEIIAPQWFEYPAVLPEALAEIRSLLDYEFTYMPDTKAGRTLRELLQPFLAPMPWSAFGIDLALGLPADKIATAWEFQYLPDEMLIAFAQALHKDGTPLVAEHRVLLTQTYKTSSPSFFSPSLVFWMLFLVALLSFLHPRLSRIFDLTFFSILGITGWVVIILWFFTDHPTTKGNIVILWALPTHIYYIWKTRSAMAGGAAKLYFKLVTALSFLLLVLWVFIPQGFNVAFFPIILTAFIKALPMGIHIPVLEAYYAKKRANQ